MRYKLELDSRPRTETHSLTEPRSCRDHIIKAGWDDVIVNRALQAQYANHWTWEETLEFMAVALIENRKHLMDEVIKLTIAMPVSMLFKEGDIDG